MSEQHSSEAAVGMFGDKCLPIVGEKGVKYGLQAPKNASKKGKLAMFGGSDDEDEQPTDRNAAIRAQQGVKRSDAKVCFHTKW
jgi:hypothetical protein